MPSDTKFKKAVKRLNLPPQVEQVLIDLRKELIACYQERIKFLEKRVRELERARK